MRFLLILQLLACCLPAVARSPLRFDSTRIDAGATYLPGGITTEFRFVNTGSAPVYYDSSYRQWDRFYVYPYVVLPGEKGVIGWVKAPENKEFEQMTIPFFYEGKRLSQTLYRKLQLLDPHTVLQYKEPVFDLGHLPYDEAHRKLYWKVKNSSKAVLMCPTVLEVWNDCGIGNRWGREEPLLPGQSRTVVLNLNLPPRDHIWQKEGNIVVSGNLLNGQPMELHIYAKVKVYFDRPEAPANPGK